MQRILNIGLLRHVSLFKNFEEIERTDAREGLHLCICFSVTYAYSCVCVYCEEYVYVCVFVCAHMCMCV